jgi:MFS family permease
MNDQGTAISPAAATARGRAFAALHHPGYRTFFSLTAAAMLADNIEHVISYWVIFQKFRSPALGGFAVFAHWLPFLLFSVYSGALADRFDLRRIIQIGMLLFMGVSIAWGLLFLTDTLQMWHAMLLLVVHGLAGVLWNPPTQLMVHYIVSPEQLQSAVRLNATARYLGMLIGPAVGGALLIALGPAYGILANALIYLPMIVWLWKAPYGPRARTESKIASTVRGFGDIVAALRSVGHDRTLLSMTLLAAAASLFIGSAYQAQMPEFAHDLGHGDPGWTYSMLLAADAGGALCAGLVLESRGLLRASPTVAIVLAALWCCALGGFALTHLYPVALALLFAAGFLELSFGAMAQALVQLNAAEHLRGRIIGVFSMASLGMRTFSGLTVGIVGGWIGIHWSLALSAASMLATAVFALPLALRPRNVK